MDIGDTVFADAVAAIDAGDIAALDSLISQNSRLVTDRLVTQEPGYFADPYLLWFVAGNPVRNAQLAPNILDVAAAIIDHIEKQGVPTRQAQLDYTVELVATGRVPRESGVQLPLIDMLVARSAKPVGLDGAVAHGELAAAQRLIHHGAEMTLAAAACLGLRDDITRRLPFADVRARADALVAASNLGLVEVVRQLIDGGVDPDIRSARIHPHATALHQAALTGNAELCRLLLAAGASRTAHDTMWDGTPSGWAEHAGHAELARLLREGG